MRVALKSTVAAQRRDCECALLDAGSVRCRRSKRRVRSGTYDGAQSMLVLWVRRTRKKLVESAIPGGGSWLFAIGRAKCNIDSG